MQPRRMLVTDAAELPPRQSSVWLISTLGRNMKSIPTWLVLVIGITLLMGSVSYGMAYAFPAPDYSEEEARRIHITWSYLKYPIYSGSILIISSGILAVVRGDQENKESKIK